MPLFLDVNSQYLARILQDIQLICPDPYLTVDPGTGKLFTPSHGGDAPPGCLLLATLAGAPYDVRIRAEAPPFSVAASSGSTIGEVHGYTWTSARAPQPSSSIEIVYDGTNCNGAGLWVVAAAQSGGGSAPLPTDVMLVHELVHALRAGEGLDTGDLLDEEQAAREGENVYRAQRGLKRRSVVDGLAGCNPPPESLTKKEEPNKTGSWTGFNCFVASAAYGSPLAPEVQLLRRFRDDILRKTPTGRAFFEHFYEHYNRISPMIVAAMERDAEVMEVMRAAIVAPLVRYLHLALRFPSGPLTQVPEPWRSFLTTCRDELEDWGRAFPLPEAFAGVPTPTAAEEIGVALRYQLRTEDSRRAYLDRLEAGGHIPLPHGGVPMGRIQARLVDQGLEPREIQRVLGATEPTTGNRDEEAGRAPGEVVV
jgi:hypothetical protein